MKHLDYIATVRRKYPSIDRNFDEEVRRRKLATLFYVARRDMGLAREDVALRGQVDARMVAAIEQAKAAPAEVVSAISFVLRDGLAERATDWRELLPLTAAAPSASINAEHRTHRATRRRLAPRLTPPSSAAV